MGAISSYFTRKIASSQTESDPFITIESSTPLTKGMAASKPREAANESCISNDDMRRFSNAIAGTQEFLNKHGMILDRQRKLESELETCRERLRKFTKDRARQSESNAENISSSNSPSALERYYEQFYDHERIDVVNVLENSRLQKKRDRWTELDDKYFACRIFEECYLAAQALRNSFLQGISIILTCAPAIGAQYSEASKNKSSEFQFSVKKPDDHSLNSLGSSNENSVKVIMKETAEFCDIDALVQRTLVALQNLQERGEFKGIYTKDVFLKTGLMKYIEKCCRYAWKLVCQTPPYELERNKSLKPDAVFSPSAHQVCKELQPSEYISDRIAVIIWPGLFEGSSGRVIRKTEVVLETYAGQ